MKRTLCILILLTMLLCGCTSSAQTPATADEAATLDSASPTAGKPTAAATQAPTEEPSAEQLAEQRIGEILSAAQSAPSASLTVEPIDQYPELPTGCEAVALTMALNALGCDLGKTDIAESYLEYSDNYVLGFCGDPFSPDGAGVMPLGIIQTVRNYVSATGAPIYAYNSSHLPLSDLYKFIDAGCPAVVWTTYYMDEPMYTGESIDYDGESYIWYNNEHCVTLYGYDCAGGTVEIADPLRGTVTVDAGEFERINADIGGWSVVLLDTSTLNQTATEPPTEQPTEKPTEKPTERPTVKPTEKPTEKTTAKPTEKATVKSTEKPAEKPASQKKATEAPTRKDQK